MSYARSGMDVMPSGGALAAAAQEAFDHLERGCLEFSMADMRRWREALARYQGYEPAPCPECRKWKVVRNGDCRKCDGCGHVEQAPAPVPVLTLEERVAELEAKMARLTGFKL